MLREKARSNRQERKKRRWRESRGHHQRESGIGRGGKTNDLVNG